MSPPGLWGTPPEPPSSGSVAPRSLSRPAPGTVELRGASVFWRFCET